MFRITDLLMTLLSPILHVGIVLLDLATGLALFGRAFVQDLWLGTLRTFA